MIDLTILSRPSDSKSTMDCESPMKTTTPKWFDTPMDYRRPQDFAPEKTVTFHRLYDQYVLEKAARSDGMVDSDSLSSEAVRPVSLKFSVNAEKLEAALCLGLIKDVRGYSPLADQTVQTYLHSKKKIKQLLPLPISTRSLKGLEMRMSVKSAQSRLEIFTYSARKCS